MHSMISHDNVFEENTFAGNGAGVAVMYSKRVSMYNNIFKHNWGSAAYGLLLKEMDDSDITGNIFTENNMGIYADGANRIFIKNNKFLTIVWEINIITSSTTVSLLYTNLLCTTFDS